MSKLLTKIASATILLAFALAPEANAESRLPPCPNEDEKVVWNNCQGTRTLPDGEEYVGEWKDGKRNGQGTLTLVDGKKYVGEFRDNNLNGRGTYTWPGGEKYVGEFRGGKKHGQGTFTWSNGEKYVGKWKNNMRNGEGTFTAVNLEKYVGEWKDDARNGHGTVTWPNGNKYVGEFINNNLNGRGTYTWPGGETYVGEFRDSKINGQGTRTFPHGEKYVGEWKDNMRNGEGTLTLTNGEKYVGDWKDDNVNGIGNYAWPNGENYFGEFRDGRKNGVGTLYDANASIISSGIWADDKFVGAVAIEELVAMEKEGGVYVVPVRFNGMITLNAVIDSGSADVSIPNDVVSTLIRTKTISDEDFIGVETYVLADGTKVPSLRFRIRSLQVGNKTLENVTASVASTKADILLGQSFLSRFKSWSIDNDRHVLILR